MFAIRKSLRPTLQTPEIIQIFHFKSLVTKKLISTNIIYLLWKILCNVIVYFLFFQFNCHTILLHSIHITLMKNSFLVCNHLHCHFLFFSILQFTFFSEWKKNENFIGRQGVVFVVLLGINETICFGLVLLCIV